MPTSTKPRTRSQKRSAPKDVDEGEPSKVTKSANILEFCKGESTRGDSFEDFQAAVLTGGGAEDGGEVGVEGGGTRVSYMRLSAATTTAFSNADLSRSNSSLASAKGSVRTLQRPATYPPLRPSVLLRLSWNEVTETESHASLERRWFMNLHTRGSDWDIISVELFRQRTR